MRRPIVHIGYHKTATTWFQKEVYPRVRNLAYVHRARVNRAFLAASALHFDPAWSREQLALTLDRAPLLCDEALSGYLPTGGHAGFQSAEVARRIRALFPDARIVAFVRSQPEMIAAAYQQYVRDGGTHRPQRFLWSGDYSYADAAVPYKAPRFSFDHFDYDRLLSHYRELFGADSVHVYAYEELQRDARAFLERFTKELQLELDVASVTRERRNASYSLGVNRLARVLNRFTAHNVSDKRYWLHVPYWYRARKRLLEAVNETGWLGARATPEALLGDATVRWIRQRYWESNRRLATLVPIDFAALGYPMDPPSTPVPQPARPRWRAR